MYVALRQALRSLETLFPAARRKDRARIDNRQMHLGLKLFIAGLLSAAAAISQQSMESLLSQAVSAQQSGDAALAIRLYKEVLERRPQWGEVRSNLGAALVHEGRFQEAIQEYQLALRSLPENGAVALNLALAHYKLGQYKEAADLMTPLQARQASDLQIAELLANCWSQLNQNDRVVVLLTPLQKANPDNRAIAYQLATALLNQEKTAAAEVLLDTILRNGDSAETQLLLGAGKLRAREFNAA